MAFSRVPVLFLAIACAAPSDSVRSDVPLHSLALSSAEGRTVVLDELFRGRDATVLVFWSATCPCVRRYQGRVDALLDTYPSERVRILGISSNVGESFADVLRVAKERGVRVSIYRDESGRVAQALGARTTPTIVVLDGNGEVRFRGWLDNERLPGKAGREPWLDRALDGLLAGRTDFAARSPTYGCVITRSPFEAEHKSCCSDKPASP